MAKTKTKRKPVKKPAAKKPAVRTKKPAKKSTAKQKPVKRSAIELATLARKGNLDALFGLMDLDSSSPNDRDAYKWLCAAADFGHEEANDLIDDVMEVSSMRYDDDQYETAAAHWELAAAYLEGADGLPRDLALAKNHLADAFRIHDLDGINAGTNEKYSAKPLLARLDGDAKALLASALAGELTPEASGDDDDD